MTFFEEIAQQPQALRSFAQKTYEDTGVRNRIEELALRKKIDRIIFTGMGSSLYASYIPTTYLREKGIMALAADSSELLVGGDGMFAENTLVVAVSQSGGSVEVLELVKRLPYPENLIAVSNYPASELYRSCDIVVDVHAGTEYLTSTKTYTNSVASLIYLAYVLAGEADAMYDELQKSLSCCANKMEAVISDTKNAERMAAFISDIKFLLCVGSGYSYASASHAEIVVEEAGKFFSSRYTPGQFLHGPIELINPGFGIVLFDLDSKTHLKCREVIENVLKYSGKVLLITNTPDIEERESLLVCPIDYHNPLVSPIIEIIPVEMAVNHLCLARGEFPGQLTRVVKRISE